jgi:hypothetical protein
MTPSEDSPIPSRFKQFIGSELFRNSVLVFSLTIAIASFLTATSQTRKSQSLQYILKASEEAPVLAPITPPRILDLGADLTFDHKEESPIVKLRRLGTELTLINNANIPAVLELSGSIAAYTHAAIIRQRLLGEHADIPLETTIEDNFHEGNYRAAHGESLTLPFDTPLRGIKGDSFIIHYLAIYRNPAGLIYDTYYWTQYRVDPAACSAACSEAEPLFHIINRQEQIEVCFFIRKEYTSFETHVYSEGETAHINRLREGVNAAKRNGFEIWHTLTKPFMPDEELKGANNS